MITFFIYKLIIQTLIYACMIWKHNSALVIYWIEDYLKNHTTIIKVLIYHCLKNQNIITGLIFTIHL